MTDTRYVYLMETETEGRYKIGFSVDPEKRAKDITAKEDQENIKDIIMMFETPNYKTAELTLHKRYANYRVWQNREYFDFDQDTLQLVKVEFMARQLVRDLYLIEEDPVTRLIELEGENNRLKEEVRKLKDKLEYTDDQRKGYFEKFFYFKGDVKDNVDSILSMSKALYLWLISIGNYDTEHQMAQDIMDNLNELREFISKTNHHSSEVERKS